MDTAEKAVRWVLEILFVRAYHYAISYNDQGAVIKTEKYSIGTLLCRTEDAMRSRLEYK